MMTLLFFWKLINLWWFWHSNYTAWSQWEWGM